MMLVFSSDWKWLEINTNMNSTLIYEYMNAKLPSISSQKKLSYRTNEDELFILFSALNIQVFDSSLPIPKFKFIKRTVNHWGLCEGEEITLDDKISNCIIHLSDKWYCKQWLLTHLAHEMCHQHQWDVLSKERMRKKLKPIMSHGPTFLQFRPKLAELGIPLKSKGHSMRLWWKNQDINLT
jgi:hypothetical protein